MCLWCVTLPPAFSLTKWTSARYGSHCCGEDRSDTLVPSLGMKPFLLLVGGGGGRRRGLLVLLEYMMVCKSWDSVELAIVKVEYHCLVQLFG